jgi:hypothetical protein
MIKNILKVVFVTCFITGFTIGLSGCAELEVAYGKVKTVYTIIQEHLVQQEKQIKLCSKDKSTCTYEKIENNK